MSKEMEAELEQDNKLPVPRCCELDQQQPLADTDKVTFPAVSHC